MSYVFSRLGTDITELGAIIGRPIVAGGRVLFAGEATDRFCGMMHGALNAGRRAGEHALRALRKPASKEKR
jgi:monoamine oxidase